MTMTADRHLRASDAFSWNLERDPLLRTPVVVVALLDRAPDASALRARMEHATRAAPMFRDRVVPVPAGLARPRWVRVAEVDLDWHLRTVTAPAGGGLAEVLEVARQATMAPFDPDRPLWTLTVVEGLRDGRAAVVLLFHHALTDGIGGVELAEHIFDVQREAAPPEPLPVPAGEHVTTIDLLRETALDDLRGLTRLPGEVLRTTASVLRHPGEAVRTATSVLRTVEPYLTTLSPVMRARRLERDVDVLEVPLADLRRAAKAQGDSLNDAYLAAVAGGLRRYHTEHGVQVGDLRVTLPVSLRGEGDPAGGNRITLLRFRVPAGTTDPAARMAAIHQSVLRWRGERSLPHTQQIAAALSLLPSGMVGSMLKHVDFLASDVPGVPVPLFLSGAQVIGWYPFGPTTGAAVNVTLMSYVDTCYVGVTSDAAAVPDPAVLTACLAKGFEEVLLLGGAHGPVRRPLQEELPSWTS